MCACCALCCALCWDEGLCCTEKAYEELRITFTQRMRRHAAECNRHALHNMTDPSMLYPAASNLQIHPSAYHLQRMLKSTVVDHFCAEAWSESVQQCERRPCAWTWCGPTYLNFAKACMSRSGSSGCDRVHLTRPCACCAAGATDTWAMDGPSPAFNAEALLLAAGDESGLALLNSMHVQCTLCTALGAGFDVASLRR